MINIAIRDDDVIQMDATKYMIEKHFSKYDQKVNVDAYSKSKELILNLHRRDYDIFVLDVIMPFKNGIEVGKLIREMDETSQIIYVSSDATFALESFDAQPLHYLLKPIDEFRFNEVLAKAMEHSKNRSKEVLTIKTKKGLRIVRVENIVCIEFVNRKAIYRMRCGGSIESLSLQDSFFHHVEELLKKENFIQPHVSYAINMNAVKLLTKKNFVMVTGIEIPISRTQAKQVRNMYLDYLLEGDSTK